MRKLLIVAGMLVLSSAARAALVAPPEDQAQSTYDRAAMQREAMQRQTLQIQKEHEKQVRVQDEKITELRGAPDHVPEDDVIAATNDDFLEQPPNPYAKAGFLAALLAAFSSLVFLLLYSRRIFARARERRAAATARQANMGKSLADINQMLDRRVNKG